MNRIMYLFLIFVGTNMLSQEAHRGQLNGKVISNNDAVPGVYVYNKSTSVVVLTDRDGHFVINASAGDTLLCRGSQYNDVFVLLKRTDFNKVKVLITMEQIVNKLKEVVIRNDINARELGIIPKNQKVYTPSERKLYTATDLNASASVGTMMGGSLSADPLLNWISGRTKMLKKELQVEKKEAYLQQLDNLFPNEYFVNKLKIPLEYIKGFEYYAIENVAFVGSLQSRNKSMIAFLMGDLATKYKEIIASEN